MPVVPSRPKPAEGEPKLAEVRSLVPATDDASLAEALVAGQHVAARIVWDRYAGLVRSLLRRSLGPQTDVEDHVQETFIVLFRQVRTLREPKLLRSFLVGIAMRIATAELRRRRVRAFLRLTDSGVLPDVGREGDDSDAREAIARLYAILDRLDAESRLAFVLRHVEGFELTEVAAALDVSLATVKRRLERACEKIGASASRDPVLAAYLRNADDAGGAR